MTLLRHCGCAICSVEKDLEALLDTPPGKDAFANLRAGSPALDPFPTASTLLVCLRSLRHVNGSGETSDRVFRALRKALGQDGGIAEALLLLTLVPVLHASVSSFARAYPALDRDDLSQQAITIFITLLNSRDWRRRDTHLAFCLARELRRCFSLWVRDEVRLSNASADRSSPERSVSAAELFERDVELRHFLARSLKTGALNENDLHLLIEFKLEGGVEEAPGGPVPNAVRQRMKRLLSKMRRHSSRFPGPAKRSDTFSGVFTD